MSNNGRVTASDYVDAAKDLGVVIDDGPIQPGDLYLAGRNTGIHFLTCESVDPRSWIASTEKFGYSYDTWECRKVVEAAS